MDRGACWTTVHGVTKSRTWLSTFNHKCVCVNPHLPIFPSPLLLPSEHKFVFYVCNSISVRSIGSFVPFFTVLHLSDIIWYLSFSLFLHSVWQALGPSTLLQTADKAKKERNYLFLERGFCLSLIRNKKVIFIGRSDAEAEAPILWPPDAKNQLIGKDPDAGKDWRREEKGVIEDEMVGWHHQLDGHEFEQAPGDGDG